MPTVKTGAQVGKMPFAVSLTAAALASGGVDGENPSLVPQLVPQTPRNWSNLRITQENNRPPNPRTHHNLGDSTGTLRICYYRSFNP